MVVVVVAGFFVVGVLGTGAFLGALVVVVVVAVAFLGAVEAAGFRCAAVADFLLEAAAAACAAILAA